MQSVRLLIVEKGAENPGALLSPADCDETIVLRQLEDETPIDLLVRTCARISSLELAGKRVCRAVVALASLLDPQLAAVRRMLGLTIFSHVNASGHDSELVLALDQRATTELRQDVVDWVESLVAHPGSRLAPIRVRYAQLDEIAEVPLRDSGIHQCWESVGRASGIA